MSVRKRELPSGKAAWQVDYRDSQGVRRARQFKTVKQATDFETKVRSEIQAGTHTPDGSSITIKQASELWLQRCEADELEAGTIRNYRQILNAYVLPHLGKIRLSRLTMPNVEAFKNALQKTHSKGVAGKGLVALKGLLTNAQKLGLVSQNVARNVGVKMAARHQGRVKIPEKAQIRALLAAMNEAWSPTTPWRALFITSLFTGARPGELRGLTWEHVDLARGVIEIRQRADYQNKMGSPKSKAGTRNVPLAPMVVNALKTWKLACPKTEADDLVFPSESGGVISQSSSWENWGKLLVAAGLSPKEYRHYDLRHAAASLLIEEGMNLKKVSSIMGHSKVTFTLDTYGHLFESLESDQEAMSSIERRLLG